MRISGWKFAEESNYMQNMQMFAKYVAGVQSLWRFMIFDTYFKYSPS